MNGPTNLRIALNRNNPVLSWDPVPGATGYEIELLLPGDSAPTLRAGYGPFGGPSATSVSWSDKYYDELAPTCKKYGGLLRYRVRAVNGNERSEWAEATVQVVGGTFAKPPMPPILSFVCGDGTVSAINLFYGGSVGKYKSETFIPGASVLARYGAFLLVGDYSDMLMGTLTVVDTADMTIVGSVSDARLACATGIEVMGTVAVVASQTYGDGVTQGPGTLATVDLTHPAYPFVKGCVPPNQTYLSHPFGVARWNNYVFVAGNSNQRLCVIDVSNPSVPQYVSAHQVKSVGEGHTALSISYPYLFCSHDCGSIVCYNIRNPLDPRCIGQIGDPSVLRNVVAMQLSLNTLHCVSESGYYSQVDVSDPTAPTIVKSTNIGEPGVSIVLAGDYAWVRGAGAIDAIDLMTGMRTTSDVPGNGAMIV